MKQSTQPPAPAERPMTPAVEALLQRAAERIRPAGSAPDAGQAPEREGRAGGRT